MASELQVTTIRGVPTGANANEIVIPTGQQIVGVGDGSFYTPGEINIIASGFIGVRPSATYNSSEETILADTSYTTKFATRKYMFFLGYSFYKSTGGQLRFRFRVGSAQHEIVNYKNNTDDHDNIAHTFITSSSYTTNETLGIRIQHTGTTQINNDDSYTWWIAEVAQ